MPLITITLHTVAPVTKDTAVMVAASACRALNGATCETDASVVAADCGGGRNRDGERSPDHHKKVAAMVRLKSAPRAGAQ